MLDKLQEQKIIDTFLKENGVQIQEAVCRELNNIETSLKKKIVDVNEKIDKKLNALEEKVEETPKIYNFGSIEKPTNKIVHSAFEKVIKILSAQKRIDKNIMLVGECASGKSSLCKDVAEYLKLPFYPMSVGLQTTKSDLLGFINAHGEYITTPVRQAFENGGVLLLDEFDATHAGVVTILNSMLANGVCSFPDKIVKKHENFICLVACNTYGKGGSLEYIGRNRLDMATLDRFITVQVDYDEYLEDQLTKNSAWTKIIRLMRKNIKTHGLKMVVSPRASLQGADLLEAGFDIEDVINMCIIKGANADVKNKLLKNIDLAHFSREVKKEPKKSKVNANKPAKIKIDFDAGTYSVSNLVDDTAITASVDWDGIFTIYIGLNYNWDPALKATEIYLNSGTGKIVLPNDAKIITNFITNLEDFSHTLSSLEQDIEFDITFKNTSKKIFWEA